MILSCQHIKKSYGAATILEDVHFHLEEKERVALIGVNGAGKSTLLRLLNGTEQPDEGALVRPQKIRIGTLEQYQQLSSGGSILDEVKKGRRDLLEMEQRLRQMEEEMDRLQPAERTAFLESYDQLHTAFTERSGYAASGEVVGVLRGLGFTEEEWDRPLATLSGGQKTRVVLARLLLEEPDLLLLDEPTNHLDASSLIWLEERLQKYPGTLLLVSHDRYFLDRLVGKVVELERGVSTVYTGNYTLFRKKKEERMAAQKKAWEKQQAEIEHQEDVIRKLRQYNREKSIKRAESREKKLQKMETVEKPSALHEPMHLHFPVSQESGKEVCTGSNLQKAFGQDPLFSSLSFSIRQKERVALIGNNGTGKSTILKILSGRLTQDSGEVIFGTHVTPGVYDQEQQLLHDDKTLFEEISDAFPALTETKIRSVLAAFLFPGDAVKKQIRLLSGGERARLSLAKIMLSGANFLLLDEPTNHLDIPSREVLEDALCAYEGTVLYVSHDRYFINRTATRILCLENGGLTSYPGNYDYYLEKRLPQQAVPESQKEETAGKADWTRQKEEQARQRKQTALLSACEKEIETKEERLKEIDACLLLPETGTDVLLLQTLSAEQLQLQKELTALYEKWETLAEST